MSDRVTGHVALRRRKRGAVYYLRYRLTDGHQVQKLLGPAHVGKGKPRAGYYTRKQAEDALANVLADARRGTLEGSQRRSGRRSRTRAQSGCATPSTTASAHRRPSRTTATCQRRLLPEFGRTRR